KVDLSVDEGKTWTAADIEARHADGGWQAFTGTVKAPATGSVSVWSRATDATGQIQPSEQTWNPSGYLRNAVDKVTVAVGAPPSSGLAVMETHCLICHDRGIIEAQRLTAEQWTAVVTKMQKVYGATPAKDEVAPLVAYLHQQYGEALPPAKAPPG